MHKRDPRLHGLSHDHHRALVLARTARRGAELDGDQQLTLWSELREAFEDDVRDHFQVEETLLFPLLAARGELELTNLAVEQHHRLIALIVSDTPRLLEFGELLAEHVRFEEAEVFNRAQHLLTDEELAAVAEARPANYA